METLTSSALKRVVVISGKGTCFSIRSEVRSGVTDWNSIRYNVHRRISPLVSLRQKRIARMPMFTSRSSTSELQMNLHDENSEVQSRLITVHVKFQLQRECSFGEQFYLVGDNLMLGNWDPQDALPLEWSEGHVWTLDLDIPVGETIQYKFLLKGDSSMDVIWQPGSDRIFKTWKCSNKIAVYEDWDDEFLQKIIEEEPVCINDESSMSLSNSLPTVDANSVSIEEETVKEMEKMRFESKDEDIESTLDFLRKRFTMNSEEFINIEEDETDLRHEKEEEEEETLTEVSLLIPNASLGDDLVEEYELSATTKEVDLIDSSALSKESTEMTIGDEEDQIHGGKNMKEEVVENDLPQSGDERNKSYYAFSSENIVFENELQWCLKTMQHILPFWPAVLDRKQV
ncbi:uncharacterized protein LOC124913046 [Impatiens glandulifera]|uniref:uncharacterized protein LOC124913046 n=1 Tax=Impatiens glandulifera TaxID=253017 RepID=UPI001FB0ED28|nr:uncharacterized protein LOC124913046 [Impatiens glandulifera]